MSEITRRPTRLAGAVSLLAAAAAVLTTVPGPAFATGSAALGLGLVGGALAIGSRRLLDIGALAAFVGVAASAGDLPVTGPLLGTIAVLVSWDVGGVAIKLGAQLGREATTTRLELWSVLSSAGVGMAAAGLAYGVFLVSDQLAFDALTVALLAGISAALALGARLGWNESVVGHR